jgi:hypothetical protein
MKLREFKHTYAGRDRVITVLLLEGAEPREWDNSWLDEHSPETSLRPDVGSTRDGHS